MWVSIGGEGGGGALSITGFYDPGGVWRPRRLYGEIAAAFYAVVGGEEVVAVWLAVDADEHDVELEHVVFDFAPSSARRAGKPRHNGGPA